MMAEAPLRLFQLPGLTRLRQAVSSFARKPIWWEIPSSNPKALDYRTLCRTCAFVRQSAENRRICQNRFLRALGEAKRRRSSVEFVCPINRYAVLFPLLVEGEIQGYVAMCHSKDPLPQAARDLAQLSLESACGEAQRAQELKNLSESIQPRCVALSTIHTIHRLISSTLDLGELLPRVARLCCQVLRAKRCTIWLVDREKKHLSHRAGVDLGRKGRSHRVSPSEDRLARRVARTLHSVWTKRVMMVPLIEEECLGVIGVQKRPREPSFSTLEREILTTLAEQAVVAIRNAQLYESQERVTWGTIRSLSAILDGMESHSPASSSHRQVLVNVAVAIAQGMGLPASFQRSLQYAALLHDAGRVGIPEEILRKPSKLMPAEFAMVKEHPVKGVKLLSSIEILEPALPIILYHHERYDGTGYPKGLKRENIPLGARVLAVANAFEAMVCERPYRQAISIVKAVDEIASHAGTQFDPKVVEAFLNLAKMRKLKALVRSGMTQDKVTP